MRPTNNKQLKRFRLYLPPELTDYAMRQQGGASRFIEQMLREHQQENHKNNAGGHYESQTEQQTIESH